jgi:hypothetical protein
MYRDMADTSAKCLPGDGMAQRVAVHWPYCPPSSYDDHDDYGDLFDLVRAVILPGRHRRSNGKWPPLGWAGEYYHFFPSFAAGKADMVGTSYGSSQVPASLPCTPAVPRHRGCCIISRWGAGSSTGRSCYFFGLVACFSRASDRLCRTRQVTWVATHPPAGGTDSMHKPSPDPEFPERRFAMHARERGRGGRVNSPHSRRPELRTSEGSAPAPPTRSFPPENRAVILTWATSRVSPCFSFRLFFLPLGLGQAPC